MYAISFDGLTDSPEPQFGSKHISKRCVFSFVFWEKKIAGVASDIDETE